ncbi:hypothetical protein SAMN05920897_10926 [Alkalispirochaeta americana]|uniref:Uncharacterized protein n=1 Tax=Alkalispirochaeta americana TaxID=159291 RepID=A0A1N6SWI0_9SPIO|nr:DUF1820 family protein [Alkalispirochaeta americana]SIQ45382.1 hypothetical protein SAMN05920897_10926 [Alkalispirochaeta americana]
MPEYRIHFMWQEKLRTLKAKDLDMTHPYFVSLEDLVFPPPSSVIIGPDDDELRRTFGEARSIMLPFQSVQLIEVLQETGAGPSGKVIKFEKPEKNVPKEHTQEENDE